MSLTEITTHGTLNADGTLELDEKPKLSPGRVTVVLRQDAAKEKPSENWLQHLQRLRAEREASGYPFMNEDETRAYIEWLREGDPIDDLLSEVGEQRGKSGMT